MALNFTPNHTGRRVGEWLGFFSGFLLFASVVFWLARQKGWLPPTTASYPLVPLGVLVLTAIGFHPAHPRGFAATQAVSFWRGWLLGSGRFGKLVAAAVNTALLTIVYIFGIGPTSLIARLAKHRFLDCGPAAAPTTHWRTLDLGTRPAEDYCRQF
ncbi:MAG: hypothetical protein HY543_09585 [Deltaproteobacteria bacterium]|nr:hypothetical protein [Deltaproteobacteria bacterium]